MSPPPEEGRGRTKRRGASRDRSQSRTPNVRKIIQASHERKNADLVVSGSTLSGTAYTPYLLNAINQGSAGNNRTGREVALESLRVSIELANAPANTGDLVRILIIEDHECRGVAAGTADVLTNNTFGVEQLLSSYNFDNVPTRFKILADRLYALTPTVSTSATNAAWNAPLVHDVIHVPLKGRTHYYNTTGNGISDIDSNSIYLLVMGQATANEADFSFDSRLVFRDL